MEQVNPSQGFISLRVELFKLAISMIIQVYVEKMLGVSKDHT
jgi:hypothetical protein